MNSPQRKQKARSIFMELVDLTEEERRDALARACGDDADLRAEVEELFRADREAKGFLSPATGSLAMGSLALGSVAMGSLASGSLPQSDPGEQAGAQIGRYKLLEKIGEGGMGTIWMAEQREPVKRRVALKIIKLGMDTKQVIARFEAERQALALMDHPNIAKVFDAGATETGRPYFVMEYIKGIPVLEYCDQSKIDTKARLLLFTSVCHAIQHAHQKGIIHRDIKPSNVLVTLHDGVPVPKVIDFGVAKATNTELTTKTLFTEHRQMVGTPAYMSPEQAEMSGLDIDTRSDIYSLGVLLYELLTGTTPFDMKDLMAKGLAEMMRTIREVEPHKPSTRVSTLGDTGTRTALLRKVDVKKLGLLLRGDLDWIVMKCLEKDRTRRYETANGLAADIQRHLHDEPVTAGPPSAGYKLRKFVRRNRAQVIAASALVAALLSGIVGTSWGLVESSRAKSADLQRQIEGEQRAAADNARRGRNAEAVSALLTQCEEALRAGDTAKAKVAMDAARKRADEGGAEKDAARLSQLSADVDLLVELDATDRFRWTWANNDFAPAEVAAARLREPLKKFGADPEAVSLDSAVAAVNASAIRDRIVGALDWQLWARHTEEVRALLRRLDPDSFRDQIRDSILNKDTPRAVELVKRPAALEQPPWFAAFLGSFKNHDVGRRVELMQAAVIRRPKDMGLLMTLGGLSYPDERESLRWRQAAVAADPTNVAAYNNLGVCLKDLGQLDDAIACYRKALALEPTSGGLYSNLGIALELSGHLEEGLANQRKAVELEPTHFENYCNLGNSLSRNGRFDEAIVALQKSIELNPKHPEAHYNMGMALQGQGKVAEAMDSFRKVVDLNPTSFEGYLNIGTSLRNLGRLVDAIGCFEKCLEMKPKSAVALTNLGGVLANLGRYDEGIALCKKAIESDPKYEMAYYNLGTTYLVQGAIDDAVASYRKASELDPNHAEVHCNLGQALQNLGNYEEALVEYKLGHLLGSSRPDWKYPTADWIRNAEAEIAKAARLQPKLSALLKGEYQLSGNAERIEFAFFCQTKKLNYAATTLFAAALAADAELGDNVENFVRYNAACVALLSSVGKGEDAAKLGEEERVRLRKQALDWLRADLSVATRRVESSSPPNERWSQWFCAYSEKNPDLVSIREPSALAKLPADERAAFTQLWADMATLLTKAKGPNTKKADDSAPAGTTGAPAGEEEQLTETLAALNSKGVTLQSQGKLAEAEQVLEEGVGMCMREFSSPREITALLLHHHADALRAVGKLDIALPEARRAMEMYRDRLDWPLNEASHALAILQTILRAQKKPDEALSARREWVAAQRRSLSPVSADLANHIRILGDDLLRQGTLESAREAEATYRECLEIRIKAIPDSWLVLTAKSLLGAAILGVVDRDPALAPDARAARLREAERLLVDSYAGLKDNPAVPAPAQAGGADRKREALERVVRLYEVWNRVEPGKGHDAQSAEWRKALDAANSPAAPAPAVK